MKKFSDQPKSLLLAVAITVGLASLSAGCSKDYNGNDATPAATDAGADGNMSAGVADSNQPVTDTWITTKVKTALTTLEGVDSSGVSVETNDGVVTLTGSAASQPSINAMKDAAMRIKGVSSVNTSALRLGTMDNDTMDGTGMTANDGDMDAVTQDSQQPVEDTWITTKVKTKLHTVDGLDNTDIAVETSNGIVTLSGTADTQSEYDAAVAAAKSIKGVKDVHASMLTVNPGK